MTKRIGCTLTFKQTAQTGFIAVAFGLGSSMAVAQGIYTCVDGKGRKITSDRPIAECTDRAQQERTSTGTVKRVLGPSLTAQERAELEEKEKIEAEVRARQADDKRRDRALRLRYPTRVVHDKERSLALDQVDEVVKASIKRTLELAEQRKALDVEMEFYLKEPEKAPVALKRRREENENSIALQKRFIADQDQEKRRVNTRFDEELVKLNQLWGPAASAPAVAARPTASKPVQAGSQSKN